MSLQTPASHSSDFVMRYLSGALAEFYALPPTDTAAALALPRSIDRRRLSGALRAYAERLAAPGPVFEALERLSEPDSRVIVTGQQTGLLLGPTYTLAKAVSAIRLARSLDTEERPVLPVFWMASQDHDTAEIDHAHLLDLDERLAHMQLPLPEGVPAGRIGLRSSWVDEIIEGVKALHVKEAYCGEVVELLRRTAERGLTFADWFAAILFELLGPQGLIIINPLEPEIAPLFKGVIASELEAPLASSGAVNAAATRLEALGVEAQLGRGEDATNLFLEEHGLEELGAEATRRRLLRFDGKAFYTETERYSRAELLELLDAEPSRLTPAAGLRPITQDAALPTAATVVGPGELRYFAQLKEVYALHQVAMPLVWPRASVTVLEPPVRRILDKFGLSYAELAQDFDACKERVMLELHGHADFFRDAVATLESSSEELLVHISNIDPTLERTVERGEAHIRRTLEILRHKSAAALAKHDSIYAGQWERLEVHLFPNGTPQERYLSPFSFFLKFGVHNVIEALLTLPPSGEHVLRL